MNFLIGDLTFCPPLVKFVQAQSHLLKFCYRDLKRKLGKWCTANNQPIQALVNEHWDRENMNPDLAPPSSLDDWFASDCAAVGRFFELHLPKISDSYAEVVLDNGRCNLGSIFGEVIAGYCFGASVRFLRKVESTMTCPEATKEQYRKTLSKIVELELSQPYDESRDLSNAEINMALLQGRPNGAAMAYRSFNKDQRAVCSYSAPLKHAIAVDLHLADKGAGFIFDPNVGLVEFQIGKLNAAASSFDQNFHCACQAYGRIQDPQMLGSTITLYGSNTEAFNTSLIESINNPTIESANSRLRARPLSKSNEYITLPSNRK